MKLLPLKSSEILEALKNRILVLDGAMGTSIQGFNLSADDFGGDALEGCNENLILTKPSVIESIHRSYLKAGCDILETNTFGGTPLVLDEYGLGSKAHEINLKAAMIAKKCAQEFSTKEKPRFVAGSIGPTTKAISVTGGVTFDDLIENFRIQAKALIEGGVDYLLIETCQDTRNIKAAFFGIDKAFDEFGFALPIAVSITIEPMGTMLAGQSVEALYASIAHRDLLYVGLNCATGPEFMTDHIRSLAELAHFRIACVPNAGLPDENGCYLENPQMVSQVLSRFIDNGWINLVGGCCGTHDGHIHALSDLVSEKKPRVPKTNAKSFLSGIDYLEITDEMRPILVGERTNVIGSKKFKDLICQEKFEDASEIAKSQVKSGAQIIDICLANPDRDEMSDMIQFMEFAIKKIRAPIMIDSTDALVIEKTLTYCQGKAIINSINLEDGEERFEQVIPLAKKFGAALVVGTIDDDPIQGMGVSKERKLEIARKSYKLLTEKYGVSPQDIYWDPLVFPCATGDAQYIGSAKETIEAIALIKKEFPLTKTILGISNVSFGLPNAGREVLNSVFLYLCVQSGLDLAIVNSEKVERYASIPTDEVKLAENLLYNIGEDPISAFAAHFRSKKPSASKKNIDQLPLEERLSRYIIEGSKDGLSKDLGEALKKYKPLEIINGPLMKGMDEVGRLFNTNQLIVAEVLQSAEAMKSAVAHLEPFMEKADTSSRGKIVLATVKGDVHDIGKNLVEIILSNNGFKVINLGIKIPPEQLIQAIREHKPDIIGLSGLLVKSAQQMVITAADFSKAGVATPMLVGGAALSSNFVDKQIAPAYNGVVAYASDAMNGLELAKKIVNQEQFETLKQDLKSKRDHLKNNLDQKLSTALSTESTKRSVEIEILNNFPTPIDFERHVLRNTPLDAIWNFINPLMLYGRHLGIKGGIVRRLVQSIESKKIRLELQEEEPKSVAIWDAVEQIKEKYRDSSILSPSAVFKFFGASSSKNSISLYDLSKQTQTKSPCATFTFLRQPRENGLCLSDYVSPETSHPDTNHNDNLALFVVTVGKGVREEADRLKSKGDYLHSHILQALALETAEGYAELLHSQIRKAWGFADKPEMTMMDRFQAKYRGKRYSFGYPACPNLEDQSVLFKLLSPEEVGVQLTDGFMMDPESSVSAIVFHHPQATYFSVGFRGESNSDENNRQ